MLLVAVALAVEPFEGRYELAVPAPVADATLHAAIDEGTAGLSMFTRGIVRSVLQSKLEVCPVYELALTDRSFRWHCNEIRLELAVGPLHERVDVPRFGPMDIRIEPVDDAVLVHARTRTGASEERFTLDEDALTFAITLTSNRLSGPVRWTLPYRRVP